MPQGEEVIGIQNAFYKRSSKPVMKGSRVETIEQARKEYKELLEEGWRKTSIYNHYFWYIIEDTRNHPRASFYLRLLIKKR